jgi:hypothetical protein
MKPFLFFVSALLLAGGLSAQPCACKTKPTVEAAVRDAGVVLVGKVVSQKMIQVKEVVAGTDVPFFHDKMEYEVLISRILKGTNKSRRIKVHTGLSQADCGFGFEVKKSYVIYGQWQDIEPEAGKKAGQVIDTDRCTRTQENSKAEVAAIKKAKKAEKAKPELVRYKNPSRS